jgi:nitrite reductase/ring-hydroxylating ferredoxin subunit
MRVRAGSFEQLRAKGRIAALVGGKPVLVVWVDDRAYAVEDNCPHLDIPLRQAGAAARGRITCVLHNLTFDLATGACRNPYIRNLCVFEVAINGDDVLVGDELPVMDG